MVVTPVRENNRSGDTTKDSVGWSLGELGAPGHKAPRSIFTSLSMRKIIKRSPYKKRAV
jgi:hypothetical protein